MPEKSCSRNANTFLVCHIDVQVWSLFPNELNCNFPERINDCRDPSCISRTKFRLSNFYFRLINNAWHVCDWLMKPIMVHDHSLLLCRFVDSGKSGLPLSLIIIANYWAASDLQVRFVSPYALSFDDPRWEIIFQWKSSDIIFLIWSALLIAIKSFF